MNKGGLIVGLVAVVVALGILITVPCKSCDGNGELQGSKTIQIPCGHCDGTGKGEWEMKRGTGTQRSLREVPPQCVHCQGKGQTPKQVPQGPCSSCDAKGDFRLYQLLTR